MTARMFAKVVAQAMISKKGHDVLLMDLRKVTSTADFFVLCSADSDTQVKAIADAVEDATERKGQRVWKKEGHQALQWVILDYVDVVAHVFHRETRSFYNLERLWSDAAMIPVVDEENAAPRTAGTKSRAPQATKRKRAS